MNVSRTEKNFFTAHVRTDRPFPSGRGGFEEGLIPSGSFAASTFRTMISSEGLRPTSSGGRKPPGKLASRLEEVKNPWRQVSTLELSHNEAARLATDALLEHGEKEYRRVLTEERELNFLSPLEIRYITQYAAAKNNGFESNGTGAAAEKDFGDGDAVSELTSGTYFPMMSDEEPPMLELGWPESPTRYGPSETQIYFQRDKSHNVKDLIRSLINKAKKVRQKYKNKSSSSSSLA